MKIHWPSNNGSYIEQTKASARRLYQQTLKGTPLEQLILRIKALIEENKHLTFWLSTFTLFTAAPSIFLGASTIGLLAAVNNHFGLRERVVEHLSWETSQGLVGGIVFVCGLLFHYHIQCAWGGIAAGSHLYRIWTGQVNPRGRTGWQALDDEMHLVTREASYWLSAIIPLRYSKVRNPADSYQLVLPCLNLDH